MPSAGASSQDGVGLNSIGTVLNHDKQTGQNLRSIQASDDSWSIHCWGYAAYAVDAGTKLV